MSRPSFAKAAELSPSSIDRPSNKCIGVAALLALLGVAAAALLWLFEHQVLAIAFGIIAIAIATGLFWLGRRQQLATEAVDFFIESIYRRLGYPKPTRDIVRADQWAGFAWGGFPRRIRIRVAGHVDEEAGDFASELEDIATRRFGKSYKQYQPRAARRGWRGVLYLRQFDIVKGSPDETRQLVTKVAHSTFGGDATSSVAFTDKGKPSKVDISFTPKPQFTIADNQDRIERAISAYLPGRWRARWDLESQHVALEIRPPMPSMVRASPAMVGDLPPDRQGTELYGKVTIPTSVDEDGDLVRWDPVYNPQGLYTGGTGTGKTASLHTLLVFAALIGWKVWVLDGKRTEFLGFRDWPNVALVASTVAHQIRLVHAMHDEMERRYDLIESGKGSEEDFEPLIVIVDEFATFKAAVDSFYSRIRSSSEPRQSPVFEMIRNVQRLGRTARIHLILGLQRPDVTFLSGEGRDNVSFRTAWGRVSADASDMMWENSYTGVALPPKSRGRGFTFNEAGAIVEVQGLYTPDPRKARSAEDLEQLDAFRTATVRVHERVMVSDLNPADFVDAYGPSYWDYAEAPIVPWRDIPTAEPDPAPAVEQADPEPEPVDEFADYYPQERLRPGQIAMGDLVLADIDGAPAWWVLVAEIEPDPVENDRVLLEVTSFDTGERDVISEPVDDQLMVRRQKTTS